VLAFQCRYRARHAGICVFVRKSAVIVLQNQAYSETFYTETEISTTEFIENKDLRQLRPQGGADRGLDGRVTH